MATQTYNAGDLNILKVFMYMRGVQGGLILVRVLIEKLINFMRKKFNENGSTAL